MPWGAKSRGAGPTGSSAGRSQEQGAGVSPGDSSHRPARASSPGGDWQAACAPAPRRPAPRGPASRRGHRLYIPLLGGAGRAGTVPPPPPACLLPHPRLARSIRRTHGPPLDRTHGPRAGMEKRGPATGTLLPGVLLALLVALVGRGAAAPNGTRPAELGRGWDGLVARSLARLPVAAQPPQAAVRSGAGDYLLGLKRLRRLYCNVGIGFHLQVLPDGRIGGVHADTSDSECGARQEGGDPGSRPGIRGD